MTRIFIGSDHVSFDFKQAVIEYLNARGLDVVDEGPYSSEVLVDYNDYAQKVARKVADSEDERGIVICGTGLGASIAANKVKGARAALCHDVYTAHQSRAHNDANILALGAWIVSPQRMPGIVDEWLDTPFEGGRHTARVKALDRFISSSENSAQSKALSWLRNNAPLAVALSVKQTSFGPVLFSGRLKEGFAALNKAGFKFVELSVRKAEDLQVKELSGLLQKYNLKVSALATGQGCIHDGLCLCATDPGIHRAAVDRMKKIIDLAHQLKAAVIIGGVRGKLTGTEIEQQKQSEMEFIAIQECSTYAAALEVTLLLEAINRYETNFINNASEALSLVEKIGTPNLKILLDTFHMNIEEVDMPTAIKMAGDRLGYVHLVDSNRQAPGQGHIDFGPVFSMLAEKRYNGVLSAEILPLPDDESAVRRTANYLEALGLKDKP